MSLRRLDGFRRYAVAVQYHGGSFLGVTYQGRHHEDCLIVTRDNHNNKTTSTTTDVRGYRSVEGRIRQALDDLFGSGGGDGEEATDQHGWENFQISSRTDRGVHALKNTFHVDIRHPLSPSPHHPSQQSLPPDVDSDSDPTATATILQKLRRGLNYHLARQTTSWSRDSHPHNDDDNERERCSSTHQHTMLSRVPKKPKHRRNSSSSTSSSSNFTVFEEDDWRRHSVSDELRIVAAQPAPQVMFNPFSVSDPTQPTEVDWNARFSATQRTYVYRILNFNGDKKNSSSTATGGGVGWWGVPFEWDRSWRLRNWLNVGDMQQAAKFLEGTHDFSSFRGAGCQRQSPVVHIRSIHIQASPYDEAAMLWGPTTDHQGGGRYHFRDRQGPDAYPQLVTIAIVGNAFLYRQVRNMVGCLVEVGTGRIPPNKVEDLLRAKDRRLAPRMAPAHGLFLVDVQHGDFHIG